MSKYYDFLKCSLENPNDFVKAFKSAINEVRGEELGINAQDASFELSFNGDKEAISEIAQQSLKSTFDSYGEEVNDVPKHLKKLLSNWENSATVFRGTRLPSASGSFDIDGIHATPCLNAASSYARGISNNSTGIGRILNKAEFGFLTSYEVKLSTKTYANFEYEDFLKKQKPDSNLTLFDLKNDISELAVKFKDDFFIDDNSKESPAYTQLNQLSNNKKNYEVVILSDHPIKSRYLTTQNSFIKLNLNNPKIDQILARIQEALLRDFYEIMPLQDALSKINFTQEHTLEEKNIIERSRAIIKEKLKECMQAPWKAKSLEDVSLVNSEYANERPYIKNSKYVGSAMDQKKIIHSPEIEKLKEISIDIYFKDFNKVKIALDELDDNLSKEKSLKQLIFMRQNQFSAKHILKTMT